MCCKAAAMLGEGEGDDSIDEARGEEGGEAWASFPPAVEGKSFTFWREEDEDEPISVSVSLPSELVVVLPLLIDSKIWTIRGMAL